MTEKTLTHWLIIDWKNEKTRTRKTRDEGLGPYEIQTKLELDVVVPDVDVDELAATVEVPTPKVHSAVVEAIDDEDLLPWQKAAQEVFYEAVDDGELRGFDNYGEDAYLAAIDEVSERLTTRTLIRSDQTPATEVVFDHCKGLVREEVEQ